MSKSLRYLVEQVSEGTIDPEIAAEMISILNQESDESTKDIAIIGMACNLPGASHWREFWDKLRSGTDFISDFPEERRKDMDLICEQMGIPLEARSYMKGGYLNRIDEFDYSFFQLNPREAELMDPNQRLFLQTAWHAMEDAGYGGRKWSGTKTGVFLGHSSDFGEEYKAAVSALASKQYALSVPGNIKSMTASRLAYLLDFKGPAVMIDTACSSSLVALHLACQAIRNGDCSQALVGGAKINLFPMKGSVVESIGIASSDGKARSFDAKSDGTGFGEGVIVFALKALSKAIEDRDPVHAVIKGSAINQDGNSIGITAPNPIAQSEVIRSALTKAGVTADSMSYIEAHGTGTKLGDPIEIEGLKMAFESQTTRKQYCAIGSVKSNLGHLDHLAGAAGLLKAVLALKFKEIPGTLHIERPNKQIDFGNTPFYVNDKRSYWNEEGTPRRCGVSSFGLSGTNCHVILEESPIRQETKSFSVKGEPYIFTLSAEGEAALQKLAKSYAAYLLKNRSISEEGLCYTIHTGRDHYDYRLAILFTDQEDLKYKLFHFLSEGSDTSKGIYSGKCISVNSNQTDGNISLENPEMLCRLYVEGAFIDWRKLYDGKKIPRINLPVYTFQPIRCWLTIHKDQSLSKTLYDEEMKRVDSLGLGHSHTEIINTLTRVWSENMGYPDIDTFTNYFNLGADSIMATQIISEINKIYPVALNISDLYLYETIEQLATWIASCLKESSVQSEELELTRSVVCLDAMEPFNDVFYKSCFYSSFLPVINYFGISKVPVLLNDVFIVQFQGDLANFRIGALPIVPLDALQEKLGLIVETGGTCGETNLKDTIICSLDQGKPVIVWVDCYEMQNRQDTYLQTHLPHTLLIFGYDITLERFMVIEHKHRDTLSYEKQWIPMKDVIRGHTHYCKRFKREDENSYYLFESKTQKNDSSDSYIEEQAYKNALLMHESELIEGLYSYKLFVEHVVTILSDPMKLNESSQLLLESSNVMIQFKLIEDYRNTNIFFVNQFEDRHSKSVLKVWQLLRTYLIKFVHTGTYKYDAILKLTNSLYESVKTEKLILNQIIGYEIKEIQEV